MSSNQLLARVLNRRIRITGDQDPLFDRLYDGRYQWMRLDNLKVSPRVYERIIAQRNLPDYFELSYDKRLAVIIPFRNRDAHLAELAPRLTEYLTAQHITHTIFVIDQADDNLFNRAKLINAGVQTAGDDYDYYCFHDVDMLPVDCSYGCPTAPFRLFTQAEAADGIRDISSVFFSGITSVTREDFLIANGYSNNFWHWGKEDDNFLIRLLLQGRNPMLDLSGRIVEFDDSTDRHKLSTGKNVAVDKSQAEKYIRRNRRYQNKVARGKIDPSAEGFSTLSFELLDAQQTDLYTHVRVRL